MAEGNLNEAIKINSEDIYTQYSLGHLKRAQLKFDEAVKIFNFKRRVFLE